MEQRQVHRAGGAGYRTQRPASPTPVRRSAGGGGQAPAPPGARKKKRRQKKAGVV